MLYTLVFAACSKRAVGVAAAVELSASPGDALNLTGDIAGVRRQLVLVVQLREAEKLAVSPYLAKMLGTLDALHVQSYAVAPTLAGHALAALTRPPATT